MDHSAIDPGRFMRRTAWRVSTAALAYGYDAAGNMTQRTDEASVVVDFEYDKLDRLTKRYKDATTNANEEYVYDGLSRLITARKGTAASNDSISRSIFSYDALSRETKESQAIAGGGAKDVQYVYDKAGNQISLYYHSAAATTSYGYDSRDRGTQIKKGADVLADYTWLGNAVSKRETTSEKSYTFGGNADKPKFRCDYQRDGLARVSRLECKHLTRDQATADYRELGSWDYTWPTKPLVQSPKTESACHAGGRPCADQPYPPRAATPSTRCGCRRRGVSRKVSSCRPVG